MTLIELLVVLIILGIVASVAVLAARAYPADNAADLGVQVQVARRRAIAAGHPVTIDVHVNGAETFATANPDGSIAADTILALDRLTSRGQHAAR